ncbi:hypothetical protein SAMN02982989_5730 [Xaviernesmea oryzae]|uniref:Uncharacterized protein n=1 Tax=Xaviernesmea oryzae TaxID=464029 RepID=A0A1X7DRK1_9HYPH|nr:hypothetical protein [Xaviernesmea oryzae]SMF19875.1 hypothetical protein SAMN02982989_5730 [Xaviernesmea oryzae]
MDPETRRQWQLINLAPGLEWSGRARYAAAMYFHQRGEMDAETLEIYRLCSRLDDEDPVDALKQYRIGADWVARIEAGRKPPEQA